MVYIIKISVVLSLMPKVTRTRESLCTNHAAGCAVNKHSHSVNENSADKTGVIDLFCKNSCSK